MLKIFADNEEGELLYAEDLYLKGGEVKSEILDKWCFCNRL